MGSRRGSSGIFVGELVRASRCCCLDRGRRARRLVGHQPRSKIRSWRNVNSCATTGSMPEPARSGRRCPRGTGTASGVHDPPDPGPSRPGDPEPKKRPRSSYVRFVADRANDWWQIDDTGWALADGTGVKIIDVVDDASRVCPASVAVTHMSGLAAFDAITTGAAEFGLPAAILSDNAAVFRGVLTPAWSNRSGSA